MNIEKGQVWQLDLWSQPRVIEPQQIVVILNKALLSHEQYGADVDIYECLTDDGSIKNYPQWVFNSAKLLIDKKDEDE